MSLGDRARRNFDERVEQSAKAQAAEALAQARKESEEESRLGGALDAYISRWAKRIDARAEVVRANYVPEHLASMGILKNPAQVPGTLSVDFMADGLLFQASICHASSLQSRSFEHLTHPPGEVVTENGTTYWIRLWLDGDQHFHLIRSVADLGHVMNGIEGRERVGKAG
jgi:hypothetical protein